MDECAGRLRSHEAERGILTTRSTAAAGELQRREERKSLMNCEDWAKMCGLRMFHSSPIAA